MIKGTLLSKFDQTLTRVPVHLNRCPIRTFDALGKMGDKVTEYVKACFETDDVETVIHNLPVQAFKHLSIDETAKCIHSAPYAIEGETEALLEKEPIHKLARKIKSSLWRWGMQRAGWNDIVAAYDGIRSFDLGIKGLTITLDCTTGHNHLGNSQDARTWLDGVFGYLVHHKGEHVMTIGFSIASGRRLLLQQVQMTKRTGNRWLFAMPKNRMEFIVERLEAAFPQHRIHVADGADYASRSRADYSRTLERLKARLGQINEIDHAEELEELRENMAITAENIRHLDEETTRISSLYRNTGRYAQGRAYKAHGMRHYAIAA